MELNFTTEILVRSTAMIFVKSCGLLLTMKRLNQRLLVVKLKSSFR